MRCAVVLSIFISGCAAARAPPRDYRGAPAPPALGPAPGEVLVFSDSFDVLNMSVWKHEITLTGGGNVRATMAAAASATLPARLRPCHRRLATPRAQP